MREPPGAPAASTVAARGRSRLAAADRTAAGRSRTAGPRAAAWTRNAPLVWSRNVCPADAAVRDIAHLAAACGAGRPLGAVPVTQLRRVARIGVPVGPAGSGCRGGPGLRPML